MYRILLSSVFIAISCAAPLTPTTATDAWTPAKGSITTCNTASDKIIGFLVGPQLDTVLNDACAAMMPPCAYQERLPKDTACTKSIEWPLKGAKKSTQSANVQSAQGNKISGWDVQFIVTPAAQSNYASDVFWTRQECYGYFAHLLQKWKPEGCHTNKGSGIGKIKVGGEGSMRNAVFEVTIVPESH